MKLLLSTDAVGGVWRYTLELAAGLAGPDCKVAIAVLGPAPDAAQRAEAAALDADLHITDLPLDWTAENPAALDRAARGLVALATDLRADLAHLHAPALATAPFWPCPVVVVAHSCVGSWWHVVRGVCGTPPDLPPDLAWRAKATGTGLRAADAVIAPSAAFAALLAQLYRLPGAPLVVHNGRRPLPHPVMARQTLVFTAGRLWDEAKNTAMLDSAAARIAAPVMAAGGLHGPNGQAVQLAHIQALGPVNEAELARQLSAAALFVSVAVYEPFGLAVLEAAQAGLPLVLSDTPGFRELWDDAALFVPARDPAAIADAVNTMLADPGDWGCRASRRAARYSQAAMVAGTSAIHARLLAAGGIG